MTKLLDETQGVKKQLILAEDFGNLRLAFIADRLSQYSERKGITPAQVQSFVNDTTNCRHVTDEIDSLVEEKLHSSMCPDPSKFNIV